MNQERAINSEVEKFSALADSWWNTEGSMKTLHHINPTRIQFVRKHLQKKISKAKPKELKIIDVGCGAGILSESLAREYGTTPKDESAVRVDAIDLSPELIEAAKLHAENNKLQINYSCKDIFSYAKDHKQEYDCVVCMELIEHVTNPELHIAAMSSMLKSGGLFFVSTLNKTLASLVLAIGVAEHLINLIPKGTHSFEKFVTPAQLDKWCRNNLMVLQEIRGMQYNPFTKSAKLTDNTNINYISCYQKH